MHNPILAPLGHIAFHARSRAEAEAEGRKFAANYKPPEHVQVKVLEPFMVRGLPAAAGDVVMVAADDATWLVACGRAKRI